MQVKYYYQRALFEFKLVNYPKFNMKKHLKKLVFLLIGIIVGILRKPQLVQMEGPNQWKEVERPELGHLKIM